MALPPPPSRPHCLHITVIIASGPPTIPPSSQPLHYQGFLPAPPGWPPPAVIWYEGQKLLDDSYEADTDLPSAGAVENELTLEPLTRADLGRRLTCTASNTNTTQPATTTVTLDLTRELAPSSPAASCSVVKWTPQNHLSVCHL